MSLDVLAIAAHPDDIEQTCGGTLIAMAEKGYRTGALDLTAGDMGTRGTPEQRLAEFSSCRPAAEITKTSYSVALFGRSSLTAEHLEIPLFFTVPRHFRANFRGPIFVPVEQVNDPTTSMRSQPMTAPL